MKYIKTRCPLHFLASFSLFSFLSPTLTLFLLRRFRIVFVCGNFWHLAAGNGVVIVVVVVSQVVAAVAGCCFNVA